MGVHFNEYSWGKKLQNKNSLNIDVCSHFKKRRTAHGNLRFFLAITDVRIQTRRAEMGGVAGFFDKELKNSRVGILKESENIHVWFQNCYSFNNLVSIYI